MGVFVFSTSRGKLCKQRNSCLVPLAWSAPQDYCLPLASPLHFGSTQSLQTLQQSLPSASAKKKYQENEGNEGKISRHIQRMSYFFPQSLEKDRSDGRNQPGMSMKWPLLWGDPAGFKMKTMGKRGQKDVLVSVVNQGWKIKLSQRGECQRTHPSVDFSSSNKVRCETPSIVPISF